MSEEARRLLAEALGLPENERGELAARLIDSLDAAAADPGAGEWDAEIRRRLEDLDRDCVRPIPWAEARRMIESDGDGSAEH